MELSTFNHLIDKIHAKERLSAPEIAYIQHELPLVLQDLPTIRSTREYLHPTGIHISGAPARTYLAAYALILAKKAYGRPQLTGHSLYDAIENRLTIGIMRSNFEAGKPRGYYCCKVCSMGVFPLFALDCLYWIDGKRIAEEVRPLIESRDPYFTKGVPMKLLNYTLTF